MTRRTHPPAQPTPCPHRRTFELGSDRFEPLFGAEAIEPTTEIVCEDCGQPVPEDAQPARVGGPEA